MTALQRSLDFAIDQINAEIAFVPHKVTGAFSSRSSFAALDLRLAAHVAETGQGQGQGQVGVQVKDLFTVDAVKADTSALEFIAHSRRKLWPWPPCSTTKRRETDVMVALCKELFVPLCREVLLERRYTTRISHIPELQSGDLGLGSVATWHGTPDARLGGMEVVWRKDSGETVAPEEAVVSEDEGSVQSDGTSTVVEGKVMSKEANLPQAVGTCVVASFTAKARHPEQSALVPTVLIDEKLFRVCLYDCDHDVLLISTSKPLATKGTLSRSGMAFLWLVINHR